MSPTTARVLRVLTIAVFVGVLVAAGNLAYRAFAPGEPESVATPAGGELNVADAIDGPETGVLVVRGHVFDGPGGLGLRLCHGRQNTSPPLCLGPFLDLDGVNEGSFSFEEETTDEGEVRWVEEPLALRGTIEGTRMNVTEVLR